MALSLSALLPTPLELDSEDACLKNTRFGKLLWKISLRRQAFVGRGNTALRKKRM